MKAQRLLLPAIAASALLATTGLRSQEPEEVAPAAQLKPVVQAWEHLALTHDDPDINSDRELARKINKLGDQGWQLVDVEAINVGGTARKVIFFFKRPK